MNVIHVISFAKFHIICVIVSIYAGGEKRLTLSGLMLIASNMVGTGTVVTVASSSCGERSTIEPIGRSGLKKSLPLP